MQLLFSHKPVLAKSNHACLQALCICQVRKQDTNFPRRKGALRRPACATKEKQSPVIACHLTELGFKMQDRWRVWQRILQTSQGR